MKPIIQILSLSKKYKDADNLSLDDLTLDINEGDIFGLLGPNGAGKTTLISMLCGLLEPTSGDFTIDGLNFAENAYGIKKIIGVVPQEYALYPTLTARENLMYFGSMYGLKGDALKEKIADSLELLGLLKFADKRIENFSGGMKRRVNLIAGILHINANGRLIKKQYFRMVQNSGNQVNAAFHATRKSFDSLVGKFQQAQ